jgi:cytochrome P450
VLAELLDVLFSQVQAGVSTITASLDCILTRLAGDAGLQHAARTETPPRARLIEELLRIESPVMMIPRRAAHDTTCHDATINEGDVVLLMLGAANTDERQFSDPLTIDTHRNSGHLAFAAGPHRCLGAHLARMELSVALDEIFAAFDTFAIPAGQHIDFMPAVRSAKQLPLQWAIPNPATDQPADPRGVRR